MKKSLIALAVLAASGAAMAQSSVTLYGRADVNYSYSNVKGDGLKFRQNSGGLGGSRIGFRGVEDLGNGLKAGFVLEYGTSVDTGSGFTARQSFVSLAGNFGEVRFGRQYSLYDTFAGNFGGAHGTVWNNGATLLTAGGTNGSRNNNAATYISPNFSGFKVTAQAATKEEAIVDNGKRKNPYAIGLDYANGPVGIGFVAGKNSAAGTDAIYSLGGSYDFGPVALLGAYEYNKNKESGKGAYTVGVKAPLGATTLRLTYGQTNRANGQEENGSAFSLFGEQKVRQLALGADYKLSKRSTVYGGYALLRGKNAVASSDNKKNVQQVTVGFDHWF